MNKLLYKPLKAFTLYALLILACSIPAYYATVDFIWLNELDEHNLIIKERIEKRFSKIQIAEEELENVLRVWNTAQAGTKLVPSNSFVNTRDSVYTATKQNEYAEHYEIDRFRGLSSYITINGKPYHLTVETNIEEADETMLAIAIVTSLFFVLLVIGFIFLNKHIAKNIWQPFQNTLEKLQSFNLLADKTISLEKTDIEEFEELHRVLRKLIEKNVSVFNQQKIFIENASHELQTPLAVLKSKMDLLLQSEDITHAQSEMLNAIALPLSRISRINKNLLLLAKLENSQFTETHHLDLSGMINETIELLTDYSEEKRLNLIKDIHQASSITCNKFLLETLLNNLLTNAIRHTPESGLITIEMKGKILEVKNTGAKALNKEHLFERFSVTSSETTNSGLGLAIVKEICNRYQWRVSYAFADNLHIFSITF